MSADRRAQRIVRRPSGILVDEAAMAAWQARLGREPAPAPAPRDCTCPFSAHRSDCPDNPDAPEQPEGLEAAWEAGIW